MIDRFIAALREAALEPDWRDLADALWLADVQARAAEEHQDRTLDHDSAADQPLEPHLPDAAATEGKELPSGTEESTRANAQPPSRHVVPEAGRRMPASWQLAERAGPGTPRAAGLEAIAPGRYALPGGQEIGRALRPLKQRRRTPRRRVFDPEATVEQFCDTGVLV